MVNVWVKVGKIGLDYISVKLESLSTFLSSLSFYCCSLLLFFFLNRTVLKSVTYGTEIGIWILIDAFYRKRAENLLRFTESNPAFFMCNLKNVTQFAIGWKVFFIF